jgi:septal ring factor EnvC (AmiA/AmiB activator)
MPAKTTDSIGLNVRFHGAVNRGAAFCFAINRRKKNASHVTGVFHYGFEAFTSLVPQLALLQLERQRREQERRQEQQRQEQQRQEQQRQEQQRQEQRQLVRQLGQLGLEQQQGPEQQL